MTKIGFLKKSERKRLFAFYRSIYSPRHVLLHREFLDWYTINSPYFKNSDLKKNDLYPIIVARRDNKILGQLILQPSVFNCYGRAYKMAWVSNWIIRPEARSRGLAGFFIKFLVEQDFDFFAANMVTPEVRKITEHFGFKYRDLNRYLGILSEDVASIVQNPKDPKVKKRIKEAIIKEADFTAGGVRSIKKFSADYNKFWRQAFAPQVLGSPRSSQFLNWRYTQSPFFNYESFLVYNGKGDIGGMMVLRIEDIRGTKVRACRLVEFFVKEPLVDEAVDFLLNYACDHNCAFIDYYNLYGGFDAAFAKAGILKNDPVLSTEIPRLTQPVAHENWFINAVFFANTDRVKEKDFLNFKNWYTTSGDADQDRKNFS